MTRAVGNIHFFVKVFLLSEIIEKEKSVSNQLTMLKIMQERNQQLIIKGIYNLLEHSECEL